MLDFLWLISLAPIEFCMKVILDEGYDLMHSYGLALIGMSLIVNTAILPIYNMAERWQEEERALKKRMAHKEQMIRRCFRGQERFAMINTLYRQFGYSPLLSLRASIGILLQIPFFFAAYSLLSNMPVLDGVSFGPIHNLGAPDGLLVIGALRINALPIIMTLINLLSAFFYTHGLSRRDKIQLYVMATLFLVLLYNSPAALTFYWTLNNIYSLGKNIVEKNCMKRPGWLAVMQKLKSRRIEAARKLQELGTKVVASKVQLVILASLLILGGICGIVYGIRKGQEAFLLTGWSLLSMGVILLSLDFIAKARFARLKRLPFFQALAVLVGLGDGAFIICKYGVLHGNLTRVVTLGALLACFVLCLVFARPFLEKIRPCIVAQKKELRRLFLPAGGLTLFLVFVYSPFVVFSSDPAVFDMSLDNFTASRLGIFFVTMLGLALLGTLLGATRWFFGSLLLILAFAALTFHFVVAPDAGVMDSFILQKREVLSRWYNTEIDFLVFFSVSALFFVALRWKKIKILADVIYASITLFVILTAINFFTAKEAIANIVKLQSAVETDLELPQQVKDFFTFSKNGKNIVVVMLDMFTGGNMNQIIETHPELRTQLDGFIWYEDVVTGGTKTIFGKPGILGGEDALPLKLNEDKKNSLEEKISRAYANFFNYLLAHNFRISVFDEEFLHPDLIEIYLTQAGKTNFIKSPPYLMWEGARTVWEKKYDYAVQYKQDFNHFFDMIGWYNIFPIHLREKLYTKGTWNKTISKEKQNLSHASLQLANLELPLYASHISATDVNSFMYFSNLITHMPWALDENGMPSLKGGWDDTRNLSNFGLSEPHLLVEYFALKKLLEWFEWMKRNNVYDNTQIIVVSDHGRGDSAEIVKMWGGFPPVNVHGLLLVKEFGAHGELLIDRKSQMANWDVPIIIRNGLTRDASIKKFPWQDNSRLRIHVRGRWRRSDHGKNTYTFSDIYKIHGPLYEKKSWEKIK